MRRNPEAEPGDDETSSDDDTQVVAYDAHGGESEIIQQRFMKLNEREQRALLEFLNSL